MRNGSVVRVSGPLAAYADDFWGYLARQGYAPSSSRDQLRLMAHVSGWLDQQGADAAGLTAERIAEFLVVRRGSHVRLVSGRALAPLLGFLRGLGVAPPEPEPVPCTTADRLTDAYRRYLAGERGLAAGTVRLRERVARLFLSGLSEPVEEHLSRLDGAQVAAFVLRECPGRSVSAARTVVSGTRSLLRFLYLEGYLPRRLDAGVPGMAGWSMTALPRAVDPQLAARLIASCDPDTAAGRRDRAIVVLLARLGLRGQEVADLELDDIDWRAGEVVIRWSWGWQHRGLVTLRMLYLMFVRLAGGWCCRLVLRRRRTPSCWCCATRWRCCGGRTPGRGWTGPTVRCSPRWSGCSPSP